MCEGRVVRRGPFCNVGTLVPQPGRDKHISGFDYFLKYISDAFEEQHAKLEAERAQGADPEDPDEYRAVNIFWVLPEARWSYLRANAKQVTVGQSADAAMEAIERDNPSLKGMLPKDYARPGLDKQRLGQLIDLITNIILGDEASRANPQYGLAQYYLAQCQAFRAHGARRAWDGVENLMEK